MVPDGYGVCYNPMDDHINFAVTAFNSCEETNATKLSRFLEDALLDMKTLMEQVSKASDWHFITGERISQRVWQLFRLKTKTLWSVACACFSIIYLT